MRQFPWKKSVVGLRSSQEDVRPIFWSNRYKSYLARTSSWDDYPNGRWGDSSSPAFGELNDYHLFIHRKKDKGGVLRKRWGAELKGPNDVTQVFINFLNKEIPDLPWIDSGLSAETDSIKEDLVEINKNGFWTINSQPRVNGASSSDPAFGWGGQGGVVFQKAYLEFFTSPDNLQTFLEVVQEYNQRFNYQAVNMTGECFSTVSSSIAVTWGVFPGKQIMQPTVVDHVSFQVWKDEAFYLWKNKWGVIYPKNSESRQLINNIYNNYFLVNVVDNNFIDGDIYDLFKRIEQVKASKVAPVNES
jgi:methylenetetrahydrofolate reductase (NADPH)